MILFNITQDLTYTNFKLLTELVHHDDITFKVVLCGIHTILHLMLLLLVTITVREVSFRKGLQEIFPFLPEYFQLRKSGFA